ncbi:ankyrin repeat-containing protein [Aspergillus melleus]|uniref:ankyrin repeat-containing protein n=1 Tax=Aspergillus melleus TaxID=138277 RepID=UPI001E8D415C|nr:ankyrin repeat-containing protein [Aspergillus melleus]KAH8423581.1 ankyrin repeat-containing protein [Aspergillus melleus]
MSLPTIPADTIDDLIYDARAGDLDSLKTTISELSASLQCTPAQIVAATVDAAPEAEGGTGCCLLHYPAANGNLEILTYLLTTLTTQPSDQTTTQSILNHKNHSGNTPLHWAALNTHLECVKALVEAGADIAVTNDAGLDAVFLAERADWSAVEVNEANAAAADQEMEEESGEAEVEMKDGGEQKEQAPPSKGRQVVEWLLSSEKGGELESGVAEGESAKKQ